MAHVAGQISTSVKAPVSAIAAALVDTVESQQIIVVLAVKPDSVHAPRLPRLQKHQLRLASLRTELVVVQRY